MLHDAPFLHQHNINQGMCLSSCLSAEKNIWEERASIQLGLYEGGCDHWKMKDEGKPGSAGEGLAHLSVTFSFQKKEYSTLLAGYRVSGMWEVERQENQSNLLPHTVSISLLPLGAGEFGCSWENVVPLSFSCN